MMKFSLKFGAGRVNSRLFLLLTVKAVFLVVLVVTHCLIPFAVGCVLFGVVIISFGKRERERAGCFIDWLPSN